MIESLTFDPFLAPITADEDDDGAYAVENEFMEEKSEAIQALGNLAKYTMHAFAQFLPTCFEQVSLAIVRAASKYFVF